MADYANPMRWVPVLVLIAAVLNVAVLLVILWKPTDTWQTIHAVLWGDTVLGLIIYSAYTYQIWRTSKDAADASTRSANAAKDSAAAAHESVVHGVVGALMGEYASKEMSEALRSMWTWVRGVSEENKEREYALLVEFQTQEDTLNPARRMVSHYFQKVGLLLEAGIAASIIPKLWVKSDLDPLIRDLLLVEDFLALGPKPKNLSIEDWARKCVAGPTEPRTPRQRAMEALRLKLEE